MPGSSRFRHALRILFLGVLVAYQLAGAGNADSAPAVAVVRKLPASAAPGTTIEVRLTFTAPEDNFNAVGLSETAPPGWNVTVNDAWSSPRTMASRGMNNLAEVIWDGPFPRGTAFSAVYQVTVPPGVTTGSYTFGGKLIYYIGGGGNEMTASVTGDSAVSVAGASPPPAPTPPAAPTPPPPTTSPPPAPAPATTPAPAPPPVTTPAPAPQPTAGRPPAPTLSPPPAAKPVPPATPPRPALSVASLSLTPSEVAVGEPVTVSSLVSNTGTGAGNYSAVLKVNGLVEGTRNVTVNPGSTEKVSFTVTRSAPGSYTVDIGGNTGSFQVRAGQAAAVARQPGTTAAAAPKQQDVAGWLLTGGIVVGLAICGLLVFFLLGRRTVRLR